MTSNINIADWKEFIIGDLFDVSRGQRQKKSDRMPGNVPYYSASEFNNGQTDSIGNPTFIEKDAIICTTFGDAFYVKGNFSASDEITILKHDEINEDNGLFIATIIQKNKHKYSFAIKAFSSRIKKDRVLLPIDSKGEPDWKRMTEYVESFYEEVDSRLNIIDSLENADLTPLPIETWKRFMVDDLFERKPAKFKGVRKFSKSRDVSKEMNEEFSLPLTNAKHGDNGIMYYGRPHEWESVEMSLDVVANGAVAVGDIYVQTQSTATLGDSFLMKLKEEYREFESKKVLLFLATVLEKSIKHKFSYDHKSTWPRVKKEYIKLPIIESGNIDWNYMEEYITILTTKTKKKINVLSQLS